MIRTKELSFSTSGSIPQLSELFPHQLIARESILKNQQEHSHRITYNIECIKRQLSLGNSKSLIHLCQATIKEIYDYNEAFSNEYSFHFSKELTYLKNLIEQHSSLVCDNNTYYLPVFPAATKLNEQQIDALNMQIDFNLAHIIRQLENEYNENLANLIAQTLYLLRDLPDSDLNLSIVSDLEYFLALSLS